jgi:hypothetical protein
MKQQQRWFLSSTAALLFLTLPGCLDIATTTVVNRDGSIHRSVMIEGDSAAIHEHRFPLALKGPWEERIEKIDNRKFRYTAVRHFQDVAALNDAMVGDPDTSLGIHATLEKRFEWFFTVYRYGERHASFNSFTTLPIGEYLTQAQIDLLLNKGSEEQESDTLARDEGEKQLEEWWTRNIFEVFFSEFLIGLRSLESPALSAETVVARKEEMFNASREEFSSKDFKKIEGIFEKAFGKEVVREVIASNDEGFRKFRQRLAFQQQMFENSYRATVEMPGLIVGTNAATIEGNSVTWEDFITHGLISDYELWVESREINWWMIYLTGIVLILGFLLLIIPLFWRRGVTISNKSKETVL